MRSRLTKPLRYALPVGAALTSGALGIAAYTAHNLNKPRKHTWRDEFAFTPWEVQVPYEPVTFVASDGVTLRGWWFPRPQTDHVVIGLTGHRGVKQDLLGIGSALWREGNNVLLFDFRGCGESDMAPLSLAYNELPDARAAIAFALECVSNARIALFGYSMGSSVAILVAAACADVRVVVADSRSPRVNFSKMASSWPFGRPGPLSVTETSKSSPEVTAVRRTVLPAGVYLAA